MIVNGRKIPRIRPGVFKLTKLEIPPDFFDSYKSDSEAEEDEDSEHEDVKEHCKEGYHPVFVGETLEKRYLILKKLGFGAFSTVWFAHDLQVNKFVAIKV